MGSRPRISVVVPVHNGGCYLAESVDSILAQTCDDFELLLIDDHSDDGALGRLPADSRIRGLSSPARGIVPALNLGIESARGEVIARMDADDIAAPNRLEAQLAYLADNPSIAIAGAQIELFPRADITEGYTRYESWINSLTEPDDIALNMFVESPIPHPSAMLYRQALIDLGGYRDVPWPEDYDLWLRAHLAGLRMGKPAGVLLHWRDSAGRLSRTDQRYARAQFAGARAWALSISCLRTRAAMICGTGPQALMLFDALEANGVVATAFVDVDPRRIGGRKRGRPVISVDDMLATRTDELLLGAVGAWQARARLRDHLLAQNLSEGIDFLMAA